MIPKAREWILEGDDPLSYSLRSMASGRRICGIYRGHPDSPYEAEQKMAAHLIAAAPDLYHALKAAEGHLEEMRQDLRWHPIAHCPVLDLVRAALARAEPQP